MPAEPGSAEATDDGPLGVHTDKARPSEGDGFVTSHAPRPRRRSLLAAAALTLAALPVIGSSPALAAPCLAADVPSVCITVVSTVDDKETITATYGITIAELQDETQAGDDKLLDIRDRQYFVRTKLGGDPTNGPLVPRGASIKALLTYAGVTLPTNGQGFSETPNAAKVPAVLSPDDILEPESSFDDLPAAVYVADETVRYVRPLRDQTTDVNVSDVFTATGRLDLTIHTTGKLLQPVVDASSTSVTTKDRTKFSITYAAKPGTRITKERWDFGDGTDGASGPTPTHRFTRRGAYPVAVSVRGANGSYGRSAAVEIKVDKPPKAPRSGTGGFGGFGGGGGGGGYVPPFNPGLPTSPSTDPPSDTDLTPRSDVPVDDGLEPVEGYVLAGSELVPGGAAEQIPGTQDSAAAPAAQESRRKEIATWVVAALAAALLIGIGAASETRWVRHQMRHLRRRA